MVGSGNKNWVFLKSELEQMAQETIGYAASPRWPVVLSSFFRNMFVLSTDFHISKPQNGFVHILYLVN